MYILLNSEIECPDPISPKSGYIEVSNFKGKLEQHLEIVLTVK